MNPDIAIFEVSPNDIEANRAAHEMLLMFYLIEMGQALGWDTEKKYLQFLSCQIMLKSGESRLLLAVDRKGMPCGIAVDTRTNMSHIRRLDVLMVIEKLRGNRIGIKLLEAIKKGENIYIHGFATPKSIDWYEKVGFNNLGTNDDGTIEIFTGEYSPKYKYNLAQPLLTPYDRIVIEQLKMMESS